MTKPTLKEALFDLDVGVNTGHLPFRGIVIRNVLEAQAEQIELLVDALGDADRMLTALLSIDREPEPGSIGGNIRALLKEVRSHDLP